MFCGLDLPLRPLSGLSGRQQPHHVPLPPQDPPVAPAAAPTSSPSFNAPSADTIVVRGRSESVLYAVSERDGNTEGGLSREH